MQYCEASWILGRNSMADESCGPAPATASEPVKPGTRMVKCVKFGKEMPGLDRIPWKGELGKRVFENVSRDAWKLWLEHSKMVMNEYRLNPLDPNSQKIMEEQMEQFFFGEGARLPEGYVPPAYCARLFDSFHALEHAALRNRNHQHAGSSGLPRQICVREVERVAHEKIFEEKRLAILTGAKTKRTGAEASDRPRRNLQNPRALLIDAEFSMNRAGNQPQRPRRILRTRFNLFLDGLRQPRWGNINCFFEKRPFERVGLVKNCQHAQFAFVEQSLHGNFRPRYVSLNEQPVEARFASDLHFRRPEQAANPRDSSGKFLRSVRADDALAGGKGMRLYDARKRRARRNDFRKLAQRKCKKRRHEESRGAKDFSLAKFAAACLRNCG